MKIEHFCKCGRKLEVYDQWGLVSDSTRKPDRVIVEFKPCPRCLARAAREAR